jgi:hypothetical protein
MTSLARAMLLLSISFSLGLAGCSGPADQPPRIDSACDTLHPTKASPQLKRWLKSELQRRGRPKDLPRFVKDVAVIDQTIKHECPPR